MSFEVAVLTPPSGVVASCAASERLLQGWDAYLGANGVSKPEVKDFDAFGGLGKLERLLKVLNLNRPSQAGPLRLALKIKRSQHWRKDNPPAETQENRTSRKPAVLSIPEAELPRAWCRALNDMRVLRATLSLGKLSLDDRTPPAAAVIRSLASTLRIFAKTCLDYDCPVEISLKTLDIWQVARLAAGNSNRTIAIRLKEIRTFAVWCDCDEDLIERLTKLKARYGKTGCNEPKRKEHWMRANDIKVSDVWVRASMLLEKARTKPVGSARRAHLVLDAACLAFSVVCPLRCGDLHRIQFHTHLRRHAGCWSLDIATSKTGSIYRRAALWPELTPFLDAVIMLDMPTGNVWDAYARREGTPLFSRDGGNSGIHVAWPTKCWVRHFGIGAHIIRSLWHTMMFESEDDDQWIALALCGQGNGRTAKEYILKGNGNRAGRNARAKIRAHRETMRAHVP
ncbi:hypothetical protein [Loktanella salsilacus]|uniref:hypothetical protein n=1 Tax=Loktanella salsilacus TaxID=195913 RepID=UPI0030F68817